MPPSRGAADGALSLTESQARCAIDSAQSPDPALAIAECIGSAAPGDIAGYGDDTVFDLLWDGCETGNSQACDELYVTSPLGSGYEEFARTCGAREPNERTNG